MDDILDDFLRIIVDFYNCIVNCILIFFSFFCATDLFTNRFDSFTNFFSIRFILYKFTFCFFKASKINKFMNKSICDVFNFSCFGIFMNILTNCSFDRNDPCMDKCLSGVFISSIFIVPIRSSLFKMFNDLVTNSLRKNGLSLKM